MISEKIGKCVEVGTRLIRTGRQLGVKKRGRKIGRRTYPGPLPGREGGKFRAKKKPFSFIACAGVNEIAATHYARMREWPSETLILRDNVDFIVCAITILMQRYFVISVPGLGWASKAERTNKKGIGEKRNRKQVIFVFYFSFLRKLTLRLKLIWSLTGKETLAHGGILFNRAIFIELGRKIGFWDFYGKLVNIFMLCGFRAHYTRVPT